MLNLTFGEQVKIILSRKGMTIKELAEIIEEKTGKKMSRQNLTQRLGRDNFQEQDMRMIAEILGCPFRLSIMETMESVERASAIEEIAPTEKELNKLARKKEAKEAKAQEKERAKEEAREIQEVPEEGKEELPEEIKEDRIEEPVVQSEPEPTENPSPVEREMTIGELVDIHEELDAMEEQMTKEQSEMKEKRSFASRFKNYIKPIGRAKAEPQPEEPKAVSEPETPVYAEPKEAAASEELAMEAAYDAPAEEAASYEEAAYEEAVAYEEPTYAEVKEAAYTDAAGDINPYTGREYETNSVRMHPKRIGYVQVYDRKEHKWTDMTEWAFLGYQERKKALLGKDYEPPIYLD